MRTYDDMQNALSEKLNRDEHAAKDLKDLANALSRRVAVQLDAPIGKVSWGSERDNQPVQPFAMRCNGSAGDFEIAVEFPDGQYEVLVPVRAIAHRDTFQISIVGGTNVRLGRPLNDDDPNWTVITHHVIEDLGSRVSKLVR